MSGLLFMLPGQAAADQSNVPFTPGPRFIRSWGTYGSDEGQFHGPYGIGVDRVPIAFNVFMNVSVDGDTGRIAVLPPRSKPGDHIRLRARMPLVVAMTACSAGQSNNFQYKPIDYRVVRKGG